jgi:hypothetical protein
MIPGPKELAIRPGPKDGDSGLGVNQYSNIGLEFWGAGIEKSGTPERAAQNRKKPFAP